MSTLLDQYNLLLDQLNLPLKLKTISLATPTLLLSTLEAILGTRIIDVPTSWRAKTDAESRRKVVDVLLRALDEVAEGIYVRVGGKRVTERAGWDIEAITAGEEAAVANVMRSLLEVAQALDVVEARAHRTRSDSRLAVVGPAELKEAAPSQPSISPRKLFSPRPLRRQDPVPTSPSRPRSAQSDSPLVPPARHLDSTRRPPSTALSEPTPLEHAERDPLFSTPTRRQRPATSFLAELARASSPNGRTSPPSEPTLPGEQQRVENGLPRLGSPPISPRKSIVQVMRTLEVGKDRPSEAARAPTSRSERTRSPPSIANAKRSLPRAAEVPRGHVDSRRISRRVSEMEGASGETSDFSSTGSSSSSSAFSALSPRSAPRRPSTDNLRTTSRCTCTTSSLERKSLVETSKSPRSAAPSVPERRGDSADSALAPVTRPSRRIRVSRLRFDRPEGEEYNDAAVVSVHSSTDLEATSPGPPARQLSTPLASRDPAVSESQTPSPYTLLLLAERDRLREKLKLLERRELDRRTAAAAAAAAALESTMQANGDSLPQQIGYSVHSDLASVTANTSSAA